MRATDAVIGPARPMRASGAAGAEVDRPVVVVPAASMPTVARGLSWTLLSKVVGQGSWYISLLILAVLVAPRAFGLIAVGAVIISITTLLVESGTGGSIVVTPDVGAAQLRRSVRLTAGAGLGLGAVAIAFAAPITHEFAHQGDPDVLRAMFVVVPLAALAIVPLALLKKTLHFRRQALVLTAAAVIASAASIAAGALGAGVWALVLRMVLNQLLVAAFAWAAVRDVFPRGSGAEAAPAPQRTGASWFMLIALAIFAAQTLDTLIVGHFTSATQLGLYGLAFTLGFAPLTQVSFGVGGVLFPAIAATRDPRQLASRTLKSLRMMALLLLPLLPPAIVLAPALIPPVLGHKWSGMVLPFQILIGVGVTQGVFGILAEVLAAGGAVRTRGRIDSVWALLSVGAITAGAVLDGIVGAALAHVISVSFLVTSYLHWGTGKIGLSSRRVLGELTGIATAVSIQGAVTVTVLLTARFAGIPAPAAAVTGALSGLAALAAALPLTAGGLAAEGWAVARQAITLKRRAA